MEVGFCLFVGSYISIELRVLINNSMLIKDAANK
jgi:hypothetical protein